MGPAVQQLIDQLQPATVGGAGPTVTKPSSVLDRFKAVMEPSVVAPSPEVQQGTITSVGAPYGLTKALQPALSSGALARGSELATELVGRVPKAVSKPASTLVELLDQVLDRGIDPNKIAAMSKSTGARPPTRVYPKLPENTTLRASGQPMDSGSWRYFGSRTTQNPTMEALRRLWMNYDRAIGQEMYGILRRSPVKPPNSATGEAPKLSGKWQMKKKGDPGPYR